jgi:hypothetical protein
MSQEISALNRRAFMGGTLGVAAALSQTALAQPVFTAHPKVDSVTGNIVAFGYEAEGHGSDVVSVFEITPSGEIVWNAKVRVPYVGSLHDFAVTENYIAFFLQPVTFDDAQMARGGIHWSWDATKPSYFGYVRRGGDGSDLRWIEGPARGMYHVMGAFDDGRRVYVDMPLAAGNQLPFIPYRDGSRWNPAAAMSNVTRVSADLTARRPKSYAAEVLYPLVGDLPRQDDRYNTMPYRYGFQPVADPAAAPGAGGACYARFDHQTRKAQLFKAGKARPLENILRFRHEDMPDLPMIEGLPSLAGIAMGGGPHWLLEDWGDAEFASLTPGLGRYFGADKGVLVVRAPADAALGLQDGDVIVTIGGRAPENGRHAMRILRSYQPGEAVALKILRDRRAQTLSAKVPARTEGDVRRHHHVPAPPAPPARPAPPAAATTD